MTCETSNHWPCHRMKWPGQSNRLNCVLDTHTVPSGTAPHNLCCRPHDRPHAFPALLPGCIFFFWSELPRYSDVTDIRRDGGTVDNARLNRQTSGSTGLRFHLIQRLLKWRIFHVTDGARTRRADSWWLNVNSGRLDGCSIVELGLFVANDISHHVIGLLERCILHAPYTVDIWIIICWQSGRWGDNWTSKRTARWFLSNLIWSNNRWFNWYFIMNRHKTSRFFIWFHSWAHNFSNFLPFNEVSPQLTRLIRTCNKSRCQCPCRVWLPNGHSQTSGLRGYRDGMDWVSGMTETRYNWNKHWDKYEKEG